MQTQLDALAGLANDGKWYSTTALGAKLQIGKSGVSSAIGRLRNTPGYGVEKRRLASQANQ
jgi:biotin operon repressor